MKVLISIVGVGYGHVTRAQALINELKKRDKNLEVRIAGYGRAYEYFNNKYPTTRLVGFRMPAKSFKLSIWGIVQKNSFAPFNVLSDYLKLRRLVKKFNPDVIISEFEPVSLRIGKNFKKRTIFVFNYDTNRKDPIVSKFLLQNSYIKLVYGMARKFAEKIVITSVCGSRMGKGKFVYVNPIIRQNPNELASKKSLMKKLGLKREPILVMLGGNEQGYFVGDEIVKIANRFDEDFLIFGYKDFSKGNVKCFRFNANFLEYLKVCKCVIALGGHSTLSECVVFKKPTLVIPIPSHLEQMVNAIEVKNLMMVNLNYKKGQMEQLIRKFLARKDIIAKKLEKVSLNGDGASCLSEIVLNKVKP